jgi:hypothetical protein
MGNRDTGRLDPAGRGPKPANADGHSSNRPAPVDGSASHRPKVAPVRRHKRPVCAPLDGADSGGSAAPRGAARRRGKLDPELLETLIVREWTKTLKGPYDWGDWPLARYTLGADFLGAVERHSGASTAELAWVCSMIACGRAPRLRSLDPQPRTDRPEGPQLVRSDGAAAWCCNLRRKASGGPRLHYWIHPSGRIEFETVGVGER